MIDPRLQSINSVASCGGPVRAQCPGCGNAETQDWLQAPDRFNGRSKLYQLARCTGCSLVFLKNPPLPSEMGEHYGSDYDRLIDGGGSSKARWKLHNEAILQFKDGGNLLDLGCGSGAFLESMKGPKWCLSGIEMSTDAADRARTRSGGQIFVGDILDADFAPESFDVITCFDVLEHVYEPRAVLERVRQWLKPDGIFYLLVPNIDSAAVRVFRSCWYGLELPRHLLHFSPQSLERIAALAGLNVKYLPVGRFPAVEYSTRYLVDNLLRRVGVQRAPLSTVPEASIPRRLVRRAIRMSILPLVHFGISLAGPGEYILAVLTRADV